ncbi:DUF1127 domain-containing protein [Mesorhizobium sp. ASY16-5R]|uniref:DUF1127 domain-containing protein n=1 Tax=Mesorhizobium sp. ASY16-5R TaxID=3445772 RepID=UPI003FA0E925
MTDPTVELRGARPRTKTGRAGLWRRAASILADTRHILAVRKGRRELSALPDYLLKDLGLSRCDGDYLAAHGESVVRLVSGSASDDTPTS